MIDYSNIVKKSYFFTGMSDEEIKTILHCVDGKVQGFEKESFILRAGDATEVMGMVLSGSVLIIQEDYWGHRSIMSRCGPGDIFGESFAATPGAVLNVSAVAAEDCEVMMLNIKRMLTTCPSACDHHNKLVRNLVAGMAGKVLTLNDKITHISRHSTREKLLSYLSSEAMRQKSRSFDIPFDRQQLADYLGVERAAMSAELSKMQKDGLLNTKRSHFELLKEV